MQVKLDFWPKLNLFFLQKSFMLVQNELGKKLNHTLVQMVIVRVWIANLFDMIYNSDAKWMTMILNGQKPFYYQE